VAVRFSLGVGQCGAQRLELRLGGLQARRHEAIHLQTQPARLEMIAAVLIGSTRTSASTSWSSAWHPAIRDEKAIWPLVFLARFSFFLKRKKFCGASERLKRAF
jgi:hypothetical protein